MLFAVNVFHNLFLNALGAASCEPAKSENGLKPSGSMADGKFTPNEASFSTARFRNPPRDGVSHGAAGEIREVEVRWSKNKTRTLPRNLWTKMNYSEI